MGGLTPPDDPNVPKLSRLSAPVLENQIKLRRPTASSVREKSGKVAALAAFRRKADKESTQQQWCNRPPGKTSPNGRPLEHPRSRPDNPRPSFDFPVNFRELRTATRNRVLEAANKLLTSANDDQAKTIADLKFRIRDLKLRIRGLLTHSRIRKLRCSLAYPCDTKNCFIAPPTRQGKL